MNSETGDRIERLLNKINKFSVGDTCCFSNEINNSFHELTCWINYLDRNFKTGVADELLKAIASCMRECVAYISLGLVKPIIFNCRTIIDLSLAWFFFKDHKIEWKYLNENGDGYKLKKELLDYIQKINPSYNRRIGILNSITYRTVNDVYRLLSAHIHAQSTHVLPVIRDLDEIVSNEGVCKEVICLAYETSEYVTDIFMAIYTSEWHSLPDSIKKTMLARFKSEKQKEEFFK
ncbi:hypothetical protein ACLEEB_05540 [Lonsdalea quercina]|uniref:hypothetical protein n=1 Tax=Lonsdalea quercina TaxID=71657 RepID=UPI003975CA57